MMRKSSLCCLVILAGCFLPLASLAAELPLRYQLDLRDPASHLVKVTMTVPQASPATEIQFPAWNNLYQIRDFIKDVQELHAECDGQAARLARVYLQTWRSPDRSCADFEVDYEVYADHQTPFSNAFNPHHAFLNFAQLLFYLPEDRARPADVSFLLPPGWKIATAFGHGAAGGVYSAANFDVLTDSPVEAGNFQEYDYEQGGAKYRIAVDADPSDYSPRQLVADVEKITAAETGLMQDVPFSRYTFIYHFSPVGGGGMEHRYGAAITLPASAVRANTANVERVTAHEFFHLWNVKRIRPQGLEPIDYLHGNDTRDLWFSEGVTSTYAELVMLRAGLESRKDFFRDIAAQINELERRPARFDQSVEDSGRSAWLEKYPDYFRPERSISYYNKGELLGFLLDLGIREGSGGRHSLDDLMRALNRDFAQRGRFFTDRNLLALIAQLAPGFTNRDQFFNDYVFGTKPLDYNRYLGFAGLELESKAVEEASLGFVAVRGFEGPVMVASVEPGGPAEQAGLKSGDTLLDLNGREVTFPPNAALLRLTSGDRVKLKVQRGRRRIEVEYRLGKETVERYSIKQMKHTTSRQRRILNGWLTGATGAQSGG